MEAAILCSTPTNTYLRLRLLPHLRLIKAKVLSQNRGRGNCFCLQGLYNGPGLCNNEDGNVCVIENMAVLFELHVAEDANSQTSTTIHSP